MACTLDLYTLDAPKYAPKLLQDTWGTQSAACQSADIQSEIASSCPVHKALQLPCLHKVSMNGTRGSAHRPSSGCRRATAQMMLHRSCGWRSNLGICARTCSIMILIVRCRLKPLIANAVITRTRPMGLNCMPHASISLETNSSSTGLQCPCMARPKITRAMPWLEYS
jgi:hypothetical protein